jgi:hypothetical protein
MDYQLNDLMLDQEESVFQKNKFYKNYLHNNSFRGFWFDSGEKSYGIVLSFKQNSRGVLNIYAQDYNGQMSMIKYLIRSDSFSLETIAHDKVRIVITDFEITMLLPKKGNVLAPEIIEFTLQVLSHNSVYIQFPDYQLFTTPINKLRFGLVLAREQNHIS